LVYGFQHIQNVVRGLSGATGLGAGVGGVVARGRVAVRRPAATSANATGVGAVDVAPSEYHFIEMMACPEGCLNGGGQILAPVTDPATHRARLERIGGAFVAHAAAPCGAGERGDDLEAVRTDPLGLSRLVSDAVGVPTGVDPRFRIAFVDRRQDMERLTEGGAVSLKW
jgi:hypothetical protein